MNKPTLPLTDGKSLKLLAITSSFGLNTTEYLYDIALSEGFTDVTVARLYKGACTLKTHVEFAENNIDKYQYTKKTDGNWTVINGTTMEHGIMDEDWDVIFLQQSAEESPLPDTYEDFVPRLMAYVRSLKPSARFIWNITWAYDAGCIDDIYNVTFAKDQTAMYRSIINAVKEKILAPKLDIDRLIPTGTAIQNARLYGSPKLTRNTTVKAGVERPDCMHLNAYGRLIAGYTLFATLTDRKEISAIKVGQLPQAYHYPNDPPLAITEEDKTLILAAINNALKNPLDLTARTE